MRRFYIQDVIDDHNHQPALMGEGVEFSTGQIVVLWFEDQPSLEFFNNNEHFITNNPFFAMLNIDPGMSDMTSKIN